MKKNENKIDLKEIHQTLWRSRDFELNNLWQRSVVLTAFVILCFTGYGTTLIKLVDSMENSCGKLLLLNFICFLITLLGVILSGMWIKMAKGSKAWYEAYESAIGAFEGNESYTADKLHEIGGFKYNELKGYGGINLNNSILSSNAGEYSVSRINIGLGQVFLILWFLASTAHSLGFLAIVKDDAVTTIVLNIACAVCFILLLTIAIIAVHPSTFKSGSIKKFSKNNQKGDSETIKTLNKLGDKSRNCSDKLFLASLLVNVVLAIVAKSKG